MSSKDYEEKNNDLDFNLLSVVYLLCVYDLRRSG